MSSKRLLLLKLRLAAVDEMIGGTFEVEGDPSVVVVSLLS